MNYRQWIKAFRKTKYLQLLVIPGLIYYIIFHYIPMYGIVISFKDYNMRLGIMGSPWVGLENFYKFFAHPQFFRLIRNTLIINLYQIVFVFPAPIVLALFLNEVRNKYYKKVVQTISYLPNFISMVAVAGMLFVFLSPQGGIINNILSLFGIEPIYFLGETKWFRTVYIASDIWKGTGFGAIIYLAALSNVNIEMYEAATIDGASRVQKIFLISLPSILPTIIILLIFNIGGMMSLGTEKALLLQNPATYETSDIISTFVYRRGLLLAEYSFGAAVGVFNSIINVVLIAVTNYAAKKMTEISLW